MTVKKVPNEVHEISAEDFKLAKEFAKILGRELPSGQVNVSAERNDSSGAIVALKLSAGCQSEAVIRHVTDEAYEVTISNNHHEESDFLDALVRARFQLVREVYPESFKVLGC